MNYVKTKLKERLEGTTEWEGIPQVTEAEDQIVRKHDLFTNGIILGIASGKLETIESDVALIQTVDSGNVLISPPCWILAFTGDLRFKLDTQTFQVYTIRDQRVVVVSLRSAITGPVGSIGGRVVRL